MQPGMICLRKSLQIMVCFIASDSKEVHESAIFGHCAWPSSLVNKYQVVKKH